MRRRLQGCRRPGVGAGAIAAPRVLHRDSDGRALHNCVVHSIILKGLWMQQLSGGDRMQLGWLLGIPLDVEFLGIATYPKSGTRGLYSTRSRASERLRAGNLPHSATSLSQASRVRTLKLLLNSDAANSTSDGGRVPHSFGGIAAVTTHSSSGRLLCQENCCCVLRQ